MDGRATASWIEKIERAMEMKPPSETHRPTWSYWLILISLSVAIFFGPLASITADSPALSLFWFAQTLVNVASFSTCLGDGLYAGVFGRVGNRLRQVGRKLRALSIASLFIMFPFYFASFGGEFADIGGQGYLSGALRGGAIGLALVLAFMILIAYRYWKNQRRRS